jgi:TRAP-type C4-dicarboxylate transport system substrate-binding protein
MIFRPCGSQNKEKEMMNLSKVLEGMGEANFFFSCPNILYKISTFCGVCQILSNRGKVCKGQNTRVGIQKTGRSPGRNKEIHMNRFLNLLMAIVFAGGILLAGCAPQPQSLPNTGTGQTAVPTISQGTPPHSKPVTLRMAVADAQGNPSEPYVNEFIDQVKTRSGGAIIIEPTWDAGADTTPAFEQGVAKALIDGKYDLALTASRAWDYLKVTSFEALQAPFLITNDDLAKAVAASDVGKQMLDGLTAKGAAGLALWPEDLRHPFSVVPGKAILSPADFSGLQVRVTPSDVSNLLIQKLGGSPMFGSDGYQAAESGLRQGAHLTGTPTATGNVVFFSKYQVLAANEAAFQKLSAAQQAVIRAAAAAAQQKAISEHPSDVDNGKAWCADGGTVVLASDAQVAAFEQVAQPVFAALQQDPVTARSIAAIRDLKAKTPPSPGAAACQPEASQANLTPTVGNETWSKGPLPNGRWVAEQTVDDFVNAGFLRSDAEQNWAGTVTLVIEDGKMSFYGVGLTGNKGECHANTAVKGDQVVMTYDNDPAKGWTDDCPGEVDTVQWRLDDQGLLQIHAISVQNGNLHDAQAFWGIKPWKPVTGQPSATSTPAS